MASSRHLRVLQQGVDAWNKWRRAHPEVRIDLGDAVLDGVNLTGVEFAGGNLSSASLKHATLTDAYLSGAHLNFARLSYADLARANLSNAGLSYTHLDKANLSNANLGGATIREATLHSADLRRASLAGADLNRAWLTEANLTGADLSGARLDRAVTGSTLFDSIDLRNAVGLHQVSHEGPSEISMSTISRSEGRIPVEFLRGCGLKDWEIEAAKLYRNDLTRNQVVDITYEVVRLRTDPMIQFNSCFISYSSSDKEFAKRIYGDLQQRGVRCWFAPEDMKIGDRIRKRLDDSIRIHDKLLLILSEASVASQWIEQEVETALEKEREQGCDVLFPVRLDDSVMSAQGGWPAFLRKTRHIGDFCQWPNPTVYRQALERVLDDLRLEPGRRA